MQELGKTVRKTVPQVALGAFAVWMVPVVASQFIADWHWGLGGFAAFYILFFLVGMALALIAKRMTLWSYKVAVAIAVLGGFGLAWSTMVQTSGSENPANLWYLSVLGVGLVGALLSRLKPHGLSLTLFAMATTLALVTTALWGSPPFLARTVLGHILLAGAFATSGLLFRRASA